MPEEEPNEKKAEKASASKKPRAEKRLPSKDTVAGAGDKLKKKKKLKNNHGVLKNREEESEGFVTKDLFPPAVAEASLSPRFVRESSEVIGFTGARSFILWLHGLGDSGPINEPIRTLFTSPEFKTTKWLFPSAPYSPVSCN